MRLEDRMRTAILGILFCVLAEAAQAELSVERMRAQLAAQGYEDIRITERASQVVVTATRGRLMLEAAFDAQTGAVLSERMRQIPGADAPGRAEQPGQPGKAAGAGGAATSAATRAEGRSGKAEGGNKGKGGSQGGKSGAGDQKGGSDKSGKGGGKSGGKSDRSSR